MIVRCGWRGLSTNLGVSPESRADTKEMITVNDFFIQSEVEYRREQRMLAASRYRRAKSARHGRPLGARLTAAVGHLMAGRAGEDRPAHAA